MAKYEKNFTQLFLMLFSPEIAQAYIIILLPLKKNRQNLELGILLRAAQSVAMPVRKCSR